MGGSLHESRVYLSCTWTTQVERGHTCMYMTSNTILAYATEQTFYVLINPSWGLRRVMGFVRGR